MSKPMKFEDGLKRLQEIVQEMESSDKDLEKSLALFEEGVKLVRVCSSKLEEAKKKVEILVKKGDRRVAEPFGEDEGEDGTHGNDLFGKE